MLGDDDLKHHDDDKESDAEEVSSPASQDNPNNHHQFTDGEKEEVEKTKDSSDIQASRKENESLAAVKVDNEATQRETMEEQVVKIEPAVSPADVELNSKDAVMEDIDPQKKTIDGDLLQSLDHESVVEIEADSKPASDKVSSKNVAVENVESRNEKDEVSLQSLDEGSVIQIESESKPDSNELVVESEKETTNEVSLQSIEERSFVQTETDANPSIVELNSKNLIVENVEPQKEPNSGSAFQSLDQATIGEPRTKNATIDEPETKNITVEHVEALKESSDGDLLIHTQHEEPHVIDKTILAVEDDEFVSSTVAVNSLSEGLIRVSNSSEVGKNHSSSVDTRSVDEIGQAKLLDEKVNGNTCGLGDSNGEMKGNGEKEVTTQQRNGRMSPTCVNLGPDKRGDEATVKTDEIVATSEKLTASYNVPAIETSAGADTSHSTNYVELLKAPEVSKSSDCQVLMSFFSCLGCA